MNVLPVLSSTPPHLKVMHVKQYNPTTLKSKNVSKSQQNVAPRDGPAKRQSVPFSTSNMMTTPPKGQESIDIHTRMSPSACMDRLVLKVSDVEDLLIPGLLRHWLTSAVTGYFRNASLPTAHSSFPYCPTLHHVGEECLCPWSSCCPTSPLDQRTEVRTHPILYDNLDIRIISTLHQECS